MKTVTAAIMFKDGKVLIAQRGEGDRLANKWEFPGGKVEAGETP
jgi:8-oxo-dGTP diphosphatase